MKISGLAWMIGPKDATTYCGDLLDYVKHFQRKKENYNTPNDGWDTIECGARMNDKIEG